MWESESVSDVEGLVEEMLGETKVGVGVEKFDEVVDKKVSS